MNEKTLRELQVEVLARIKVVAGRHAEVVAELVSLLVHAKDIAAAEILDGRSLFAFCHEELNLSRDQTYRYLACADVIKKHPQALGALKAGRLNATGIAALASYIKASSMEEGAGALKRAEGRTVDAIELMLAELCPKADIPTSVRPSFVFWPSGISYKRSQSASDDGSRLEERTRAKATPLSPTSYKISMTLSAEAYGELHELRDLVSHIVPSGALNKVLAHGIRVALKQARKAKWKTERMTARPSDPHIDESANTDTEPTTRPVDQRKREPISDPLRRAVYVRDGGRCAYVAAENKICGSTWQVEIDHIVRVADGGRSTLENLRLCCRLHNQTREVGERGSGQSA